MQTAGCNKCIDTLCIQVMLQVRMFVASSAQMTYTWHAQVWLKEAAVVVITWFRQLVTVNLTH